MKKILTTFCVLALALVCIFVLPATAEAATEGFYTYEVEYGEATITDYTGSGGDITIPDTLGGYPVACIGDEAFYNCTGLTNVSISDGVGVLAALRSIIAPG